MLAASSFIHCVVQWSLPAYPPTHLLKNRAKYQSWCKVHACLDVLGNLMLLLAGMNMGAAQEYRGQPDSPGLSRVLVPILCAHLLWMARTSELMLFAKRECARRQSTSEFKASELLSSPPCF